jgi:ParB-like chromosome segregation protein Spo0J
LIPSHKVNKSPGEMAALKKSIQNRGFIHNPDEPVAYVVVNGQKHIVDGHHRVRAAKDLGLKEIPAQEVRLPYKGYCTEADLFDWDR